MTCKELYVVDSNGEIIDKIDAQDKYVKLSEGDRILRNKSIKYLSDTMSLNYKFVKINPIVYYSIAKKYPIINVLIKYLGYMDGILSYSNGKLLKCKDIYKICNISESTAKRQLKGLIQIDVIHKIRDKKSKQTYLVMNPWVAYIGRKISLELYNEFKCSEYCNKCEEINNG